MQSAQAAEQGYGQDLVLRSFPKHLDAYEVLCAIRCSNLPEIYDAIDMDDGQIVLEEYIDGITVADVMQTGKYRYWASKRIVDEECNALMVLHERGIVHRDIKPKNVMIEKSGRVVLIDFNASQLESSAKKDTVIMGTVGYASPRAAGPLPDGCTYGCLCWRGAVQPVSTRAFPLPREKPGESCVNVRR